jgi:uncharacterized glyoxalase superfamily protein PhnB
MPNLDDDPLEEFWDKPQKPAPKATTTPQQTGRVPLTTQELQALTQAAAVAQKLKEQAQADKKRAAALKRVDTIIAKSAETARKKAAKGEKQSLVMHLVYGDDFKAWPTKVSGSPWTMLDPTTLTGIGRAVFDKLKESGLSVKIARNAQDYQGRDYSIVLTW